MQQHIQTIVQHLFRKNHLRDVAEKEIEQFAASYPYSSVGQFLLAEKWRQSKPDQFREQAAKTALYFNNPTWLSWQLQEHHSIRETVASLPADLKLALAAGYHPPIEPVKEAPETETTEAATENGIEAAPATGTIPDTSFPAAESVPSTGETLLSPGVPDATIDTESTPAVEETATPADEPIAASTGESIATPANEPTPGTMAAVTAANPPETHFEPYHTIDYFASQGIQLRVDELAKDKLGQQLKSFTDWLRSMKRLSPGSAGVQIDDSTQQSIQLIAEHSVEGREIITEAMAEVWLKQGNRAKAIAIYEKLSLLNPPKSPYFANRIQQLKAL